jgi:hypothetical protein
MDWIDVAQDGGKWLCFLNKIRNFRFYECEGISRPGSASVGFLTRILLRDRQAYRCSS